MVRKSIAIFTLGAFLLLTWSCVPIQSAKTVPSSKVNWGNIGGPLLAVQKRSGERVEFAAEGPGWYNQGSVVGSVWVHREFDKSQVKGRQTDGSGRVLGVTTHDGQSYVLKSAVVTGDKISGLCLDKVSIPVSDLDLVWIGKTNSGASAAASVLVIGAAALLLGALLASGGGVSSYPSSTSGESSCCPFVYSYDGEDFHLDGEPYGGSICRGAPKDGMVRARSSPGSQRTISAVADQRARGNRAHR